MSSAFDPYHTWLGVPAHEQPANYYRLLGLELYEQDPHAIERAADRLMARVRKSATVEQRQVAREVLDVLSVAKRCLLTVEHKQAYDAGLRAGRVTPTTRAEPPRVSAPPVVAPTQQVTSKVRVPARRPRKPSHVPRRMILFAFPTFVIGLATLGIWFLRSGREPQIYVAETPEVLKAPELPRQMPGAAEISAGLTVPAADKATDKPNVEAVTADLDRPVVASSLPDFVSSTPDTNQSGHVEELNAASTDDEFPPVVAIGSVDEVPAVSEAEPTSDSPLLSDGRGGIRRDIWTNVKGNKVEEFVQYVVEHPEPDQTETIDRFEPPEDFGDQYGQRLRGYLHPPTTGSYEFSIRANAEGWLYVSTDALPDNLRRVEPETKIELEGGEAYYVEAFHKESTGRDYLTIGWKLPDGTEEKPIPGERLSTRYRIAPRHESEFVVLTPRSAESSSGTLLDLLDDGEISATGATSEHEIYRLTVLAEMETITAFRLEAIPDESLPAAGPGRGIGGRFALAELFVRVASRQTPDSSQPLNFASAVDDAGRDLRRIIDGNEKTLWQMPGRGKRAAATLLVRQPLSLVGGSEMEIELRQAESLGRLRLLATSAPNPMSLLRGPGGARDLAGLYSLYVNLGGDDFTTPDGMRWRSSKLFDNETFGHEGGRGVSEDLISNKVQGTAQRGIAAFRAIVPEGTYEVTLYFCEYWSTNASSRRFAIAAEQRVVANIDLFRAAGGIAKAFVYPIRNLSVTDGRLDLEFRETEAGASAILNAISIKQVR